MTLNKAYEALQMLPNEYLTSDEMEAIFWIGQYVRFQMNPRSYNFSGIQDVVSFINGRKLLNEKIEI